MRTSLQAVALSAAAFMIAVSPNLPVTSVDLTPKSRPSQLALIKVCVRYAWHCPGAAKPVSRPRPGCTRYCAEERIVR